MISSHLPDSSPAAADTPHVLIVGGANDHRTVCELLAGLDRATYGQVYMEVLSPMQITHISAPAGITVTWLIRACRGQSIPRGELATRAIEAWVAEWLPDAEHRASPGEYHLWIGCADSPRVSSLYRRLSARLNVTDAPFPAVEIPGPAIPAADIRADAPAPGTPAADVPAGIQSPTGDNQQTNPERK